MVHALVAAQVTIVLTLIWAFTLPHTAFWPAWAGVSLAGLVAAHAGIALICQPARRATVGSMRIAFDVAAVLAASVAAMLWGFWLIGGDWFDHAIPWPVWPTISLAFVVGLLSLPAQLRAVDRAGSERIAQLTRTRRAVLEAQELELRRIERDLHDGAQARLVLLGMQLGSLEQATTNEALRERVAEARATARDAQQDLRNLARGIYPPVLADRGLVAAAQSLAAASAGRVVVHATVDAPIPAAVEGACYFVIAEAVANSLKHTAANQVRVTIARGAADVAITIVDDGDGGASRDGSGIVGMRQRVEALDGTLQLTSPIGGPTVIRAEVPCGS